MSEKKKELTISDVTASEQSLVNTDQFNILFKKTPAKNIYTRPAKGGGVWSYVKGTYVKKVLNFISGFNWDFEIVKEHLLIDAGQVVILGKLTIRLKGQDVVKMQYGRADIKFKTEPVLDADGNQVYEIGYKGKKKPKRQATQIPLDIGNDFKAAATDALKKCASEAGVAADVYGPEEFREVTVTEENTPIIVNEEVLSEIYACASGDEIDQYYNDNKAIISKDISLVAAVGEVRKRFDA